MAILDFLKKKKTEEQKTTSTQKTTTTSAAARQSASGTQRTSAGDRVGSTVEKYKDAGRLGGNGRREIEETYTAAAKKRPTQSKQTAQSAASPLAEHLHEVKYATANKKAAETIAKTVEEKRQSTAKQQTASAKRTPTVKSAEQTKPTEKKANDAVAAHGSTEDYVLVKKAAAKVDFTDWDKKTTTQQRTAMKRSGLSDEEQWKLLNKDGSYLETLSVISDLRENRADYGMTHAETERISSELLSLAAMHANASGNDQPYLSAIPRAEMVKYLDGQKTALLQSVGYLPADDVGGDGGMRYNKKVEKSIAVAGEDKEFRLTERSEALAKQLMSARSKAISSGWRLALEKTLGKFFGPLKVVGDTIASGSDLATVLAGQENWLDYVRPGEKETATWDDSMITDQSLYSESIGSFGALGNYDDNGCGPIAIHNVNRILGEDSTFADVAYELDSDSRNTAVFGGVLGMNPLVVREYFGSKGYDVTLYDGTKNVKTDHDAYLAMYIYKNPDDSLGGHYVAMKKDPETKDYITYNEVYSTHPVPMKELDDLGRLNEDGSVDKENPRLLTVIWGIDKEV